MVGREVVYLIWFDDDGVGRHLLESQARSATRRKEEILCHFDSDQGLSLAPVVRDHRRHLG